MPALLDEHNARVPEQRRVSEELFRLAEQVAPRVVDVAMRFDGADSAAIVSPRVNDARSRIMSAMNPTLWPNLSNWLVNSEDARERLTSALRNARGAMEEMERAFAAYEASGLNGVLELYGLPYSSVNTQTATRGILELLSSDVFEEVHIDVESGVISARTTPIFLGAAPAVPIGRGQIEFDLMPPGSTTSESPMRYLRIGPVTPSEGARAESGRWHPHVGLGEETRSDFCLGRASSIVKNAMKQGQVCDLFLAIDCYLRSYSASGAMERLESWRRVAICASCGEPISSQEELRRSCTGQEIHASCAVEYAGELFARSSMQECPLCSHSFPGERAQLFETMSLCRDCFTLLLDELLAARAASFVCVNCRTRYDTDDEVSQARRFWFQNGWHFCHHCCSDAEGPNGETDWCLMEHRTLGSVRFQRGQLPREIAPFNRPTPMLRLTVPCSCGARVTDDSRKVAQFGTGYTCSRCEQSGAPGFGQDMRTDRGYMQMYLIYAHQRLLSDFTRDFIRPINPFRPDLSLDELWRILVALRTFELRQRGPILEIEMMSLREKLSWLESNIGVSAFRIASENVTDEMVQWHDHRVRGVATSPLVAQGSVFQRPPVTLVAAEEARTHQDDGDDRGDDHDDDDDDYDDDDDSDDNDDGDSNANYFGD